MSSIASHVEIRCWWFPSLWTSLQCLTVPQTEARWKRKRRAMPCHASDSMTEAVQNTSKNSKNWWKLDIESTNAKIQWKPSGQGHGCKLVAPLCTCHQRFQQRDPQVPQVFWWPGRHEEALPRASCCCHEATESVTCLETLETETWEDMRRPRQIR